MAQPSVEKNKNMYIENVKSQMRKGMLEYSIMLLLRVKPCYSSDIIEELGSANLIVVEGTLYPLLNRLKKEGLLDYEWQESSAGPPRKYYRLTEAGMQALTSLDENWCNLSNTVTHIKEKNNNLPTT
jgi:PadR family transcriptional regulator PadR